MTREALRLPYWPFIDLRTREVVGWVRAKTRQDAAAYSEKMERKHGLRIQVANPTSKRPTTRDGNPPSRTRRPKSK